LTDAKPSGDRLLVKKYVKRPEQFMAIQFTGQNSGDYKNVNLVVNPVAGTDTYAITVITSNPSISNSAFYPIIVRIGDYVVVNESGSIGVVSEADFLNWYTLV
jgi:hypothetical protein